MTNSDEQHLVQLIRQTCQHPHGSLERQEGLTEIVQRIQRKLWKDNSPHYWDALQRTWLYFCRNLCEATTGAQFDPDRASIVTWLNGYLKLEIKKAGIKAHEWDRRFVQPFVGEDGEEVHPIDNVADEPSTPGMLETTREWAETDLTGELSRVHLTKNPKVTCQMIILRRLPPETPWKELSGEFNEPIATLSTFYRRHCLPRLIQFGKEQGYLQEDFNHD